MKTNLNTLAQTIGNRLDDKNVKDIAAALWFEMQLNKQTGQLDHLLEKIRQVIAEKEKQTVAQVISCSELTEDSMQAINKKLEKKYGHKIQLINVVDPTVLGGFKIQVQDEVIDLSWREKLNGIITRMANG